MAQKADRKDYQQIFSAYQLLQRKEISEATLFIGYSSSGKTTFCQLIKKFITQQINKNLTLSDKGIYQCENVINQKSTKIGTIEPKTFTIKGQTFVDVPVLLYQSADAKKWNCLDQAVTLGGVFSSFKKVRFVLLIDQKFTQTKIQIWKKTLENIVDYMDQNKINTEIQNAFSFILTKGTKVTQQAGINRLESLLGLLVKQRTNRKAQIYKNIISNIKNNSRLQVFRKTVIQQATNRNNIQQIYQNIQNYPFCEINSDLLVEKIKVQEENRPALNQQFNNQFKGILKYWGQSIQWLLKDKNYQNSQGFKQHKHKHYPKIDESFIQKVRQNQQINFQASFQRSIKNKDKFTNILYASQLLIDLREFLDFKQGRKKCFTKQFIVILQKYGLISSNQEEKIIHKVLLEFQSFQAIVGNVLDWNFFQYFQESLKKCRGQNIFNFMKSYFLQTSHPLGQSQQFYSQILFVLNKYYDKEPEQLEEKQKYISLRISCTMAVINQNQPKEGLNAIFKLFTDYKERFERNSNLLQNFYDKLGKLLLQINQNIKAANILKKGGHLGLAIEAYERSVKNKQLNSQKDAMDYIQLLFEMFLKEEAKKTCFKLAHIITSNQNRKKIQKMIKGQYEQFQNSFIDIFFKVKNSQILTNEQETQLKMLMNDLQA